MNKVKYQIVLFKLKSNNHKLFTRFYGGGRCDDFDSAVDLNLSSAINTKVVDVEINHKEQMSLEERSLLNLVKEDENVKQLLSSGWQILSIENYNKESTSDDSNLYANMYKAHYYQDDYILTDSCFIDEEDLELCETDDLTIFQSIEVKQVSLNDKKMVEQLQQDGWELISQFVIIQDNLNNVELEKQKLLVSWKEQMLIEQLHHGLHGCGLIEKKKDELHLIEFDEFNKIIGLIKELKVES